MMSLIALSQHPRITSARQLNHPHSSCCPSGHRELDKQLYGGWPTAGLVELNYTRQGIGELRLLWPLLKKCQQKQKQELQIWINPPSGIHAQALAQAGIDLQQLAIVQCANPQEALWAAEQSLQSGCCQYVLLWHQHMRTGAAKRLQWAAKDNQALLFWLREAGTSQTALPISARLQLSPSPQGLHIVVNKLQGQWPQGSRTIALNSHWPALYSTDSQGQDQVVALR